MKSVNSPCCRSSPRICADLAWLDLAAAVAAFIAKYVG